MLFRFLLGFQAITAVELHRHSNDQSDRIDEISGDIQYILETLTDMEERLSKIESSGNQGSGKLEIQGSKLTGFAHLYSLQLLVP